MASTTSKYNQTLFARRKTSDIQRLASQYKKESTGLTGEYETAYSQYQKSTAEKLAPFEQAMKQYQEVDMPKYESSASAYRQRLDEFNQQLSEYKTNPSKVKKEAFKIIGDTPGIGWMIQAPGSKDVNWISHALLDDYVKDRKSTRLNSSH